VSMSRPQVRRPVQVVVASLLLAGGLSGCGAAGTSLHPGVAAQVGDDTISAREVNSVASNYCASIEKQLNDNKQVLPQSYLRGGVAGQLTLVEAARQLASEEGVEPGTDYTRKVSDLRDAVADLPEEQADAVVEIESSSTYLTSVLDAVGRKQLAASGAKDTGTEAAGAAGQKALTAWIDDHDVQIDPEYGVEIENGKAVPVDGSVSFAVGDAARKGTAATPDQQYAASLPDSHRCG
jgi:hypothetical protein